MKIIIKESELKRMVKRVLAESRTDYINDIQNEGIRLYRELGYGDNVYDFLRQDNWNSVNDCIKKVKDKYGVDSQEYTIGVVSLTLNYINWYLKHKSNLASKPIPESRLEEAFAQIVSQIVENAKSFDPDRGRLSGWANPFVRGAYKYIMDSYGATSMGDTAQAIANAIYKAKDELKSEKGRGINYNPSKEEVLDKIRMEHADAPWYQAMTFQDNFDHVWDETNSEYNVSLDDAIGGEADDSGNSTLGDKIVNSGDNEIIRAIDDAAELEDVDAIIRKAAEGRFPDNAEAAYEAFCAVYGLGKYEGYNKAANGTRLSANDFMDLINEKNPRVHFNHPRDIYTMADGVKERVATIYRRKKAKGTIEESKQMNIVKNMIAEAVRKALLK